jgi:hypothetical protein
MSVTADITYQCDGCFEKATEKTKEGKVFEYGTPFVTSEGTSLIKRTTLSQKVNLRDHVPEGWMWPDPYTGCCYCPTCWAKVEEES